MLQPSLLNRHAIVITDVIFLPEETALAVVNLRSQTQQSEQPKYHALLPSDLLHHVAIIEQFAEYVSNQQSLRPLKLMSLRTQGIFIFSIVSLY